MMMYKDQFTPIPAPRSRREHRHPSSASSFLHLLLNCSLALSRCWLPAWEVHARSISASELPTQRSNLFTSSCQLIACQLVWALCRCPRFLPQAYSSSKAQAPQLFFLHPGQVAASRCFQLSRAVTSSQRSACVVCLQLRQNDAADQRRDRWIDGSMDRELSTIYLYVEEYATLYNRSINRSTVNSQSALRVSERVSERATEPVTGEVQLELMHFAGSVLVSSTTTTAARAGTD